MKWNMMKVIKEKQVTRKNPTSLKDMKTTTKIIKTMVKTIICPNKIFKWKVKDPHINMKKKENPKGSGKRLMNSNGTFPMPKRHKVNKNFLQHLLPLLNFFLSFSRG